MAICDRCDANITKGDGYVVWSDSRSSITEDLKIQWGIKCSGINVSEVTGGMLLCESCADTIFLEKFWQEATLDPIRTNDNGMREIKRVQTLANNYAIALCAINAGLNVQQARTQARNTAKLWWENKSEALKILKSQSLIVRTPVKNIRKYWWQFWK